MVITPKDRLLTLDYKEIWRYRDMFYLFVMRNFRTAYKQTILGPLWFLITPILSVIVYVAVFGGIANIPTDGLPPVLFYLLGISVWGYFASCLSSTSNSFVSNADIFGKVYFPRIIMPLVAVTTNLLSFAIQLGIFFAFYIYYACTGTELIIRWQIVLFPLLMLILALMAVGFGMIVSSFTTKYRDLQIMFNKVISLWVYITPVIYPMSFVENEKLHLAMSLNPVTPIVEAIRYSLLGQGQFSWLWLGYAGLDSNDAVTVKSGEVDLPHMLIRHGGREYPLYREGLQAIRNCMELESFAYFHPAYTKELPRSPGDLLLRSSGGIPTPGVLRTRVSSKNRKALNDGDTDLNLSYTHIRMSGIFYRVYEDELAGMPADFMSVPELEISSREYIVSSGRNTQDAKRRDFARKYLLDYERWKQTLV